MKGGIFKQNQILPDSRHWVSLIKGYNLYIAIIIVNMGQIRNSPKLKIFNDISRFSEVANEKILNRLPPIDFLTNPVSLTYQDL